MTKLYLVGSLRNFRIPELAKKLRTEMPDIEVFDDWYAAGPEADDCWKEYEQDRGRSYEEALGGHAAKHVFAFDKHHLDTSSHVVLVLPAGKSGHMEAMYAQYGAGKEVAILLDEEDVRWDVMYQFIPTILRKDSDVAEWVNRTTKPSIEHANIGKGNPSTRIDEYIAAERRKDLISRGVQAVLARAGHVTERVPDGGWPVGLLSECVSGGVTTLQTGGRQTSSWRAATLGTGQEYRPSQQNYAAFDRLRAEGPTRPSTFHWLGVESAG